MSAVAAAAVSLLGAPKATRKALSCLVNVAGGLNQVQNDTIEVRSVIHALVSCSQIG